MQRRGLVRAALLLSAAAGVGCASRIEQPAGPPRGRAVLLSGLANIFSTGMDDLARRLAAAGYLAEVHNHLGWRSLAEAAVADHRAGRLLRPFAVAGHSLGADDAIALAGALGEAGVETDLLVTFDPVWASSVPPGPRRVLNFFQSGDGWGRPLVAAPGFAGRIENVDVRARATVNHFTIEKDPALHTEVVAALNAVAQPG